MNIPQGAEGGQPSSVEMMTLKERLAARTWDGLGFTSVQTNPDGPEALALIEELEAALRRIAEGDEPRPVGKSWFPDGRVSKHDKCAHDIWMYEDCGQCVAEYARQALGDTPNV